MKFDGLNHKQVLSEDGSFTAYSKEYDEHYHSTKDGALKESFKKHIEPAFTLLKDKDELHILDICFGLGFNTLATLFYHQQNALTSKLYIYSPELDRELIESLKNFTYPKEFEDFKEIVLQLSQTGKYEDDSYFIELFIGDAREYIKRFENRFDIVYQDAFSPATNPVLWTQEYFFDVAKAMKQEGVLTTYSTALKTRLALHNNGLNIYLNSGKDFRDATLASFSTLHGYDKVDMEHKIKCNPDVEPLKDLGIYNS
ncbi:tRNA (5-methylaminomethyl-2-thiouridine)(34)-methyltransferase MnmD [Sulfurimonas sp.]|uniref:tRNA (5-methylaminomethyl-2-thiouridine)(34)-methyltransferase MnmD n=1 Tax=Sulfurimonas sp. TaxID=2022749 RepID=UPI003D0C6E1A